MLRIKEIVRGFFCHSERKLRGIRRGLGAANAWHSSIMHSACPSATPFPVTSPACLITRLDAGFLPQRQPWVCTYIDTHGHTGKGNKDTHMLWETSGPLRQTDYSYLVNKTSVKKLTSAVSGNIGVHINQSGRNT